MPQQLTPRDLVARDLAAPSVAWIDPCDGLHAAYSEALLLATRLREEIAHRQSAQLQERTRCVHLLQHHARVERAYLDGCEHAGLAESNVAQIEARIDALLSAARLVKDGAAIADVVDDCGRRVEKV